MLIQPTHQARLAGLASGVVRLAAMSTMLAMAALSPHVVTYRPTAAMVPCLSLPTPMLVMDSRDANSARKRVRPGSCSC